VAKNYVYYRAGRLVDVCEPLMDTTNNLIAGFEYDDNGNRKKLHYYLDDRNKVLRFNPCLELAGAGFLVFLSSAFSILNS
jgi:hypothetical protein